jgi:hypothetical protein
VAACSVGTDGERVDSTAAAATTAPTLGYLTVSPTDSQIVLSWTGAGPYTATLTGLDGYSSTLTPTSNVINTQTVTFTGLTACAPYTWSVSLAGSVVQSGAVNTRFSGTALCPATQVVPSTSGWTFEGLEHQGGGSCSTYLGWPDSFGWARHTQGAGGEEVEFGFEHTSDSCESTVTARRAVLRYALSDAQWARGVSNVVVTATAVRYGGSCAANGLATPYATELRDVFWGQTPDGGLWSVPLGSPETNDAIVHLPYAPEYPIAVSGKTATIDIGVPLFQEIALGFEAANDGFPDSDPLGSPTFPQDGNVCMSTLENVTMTATFGPLPPETPICTASLVCGGATIACNASPETFQLIAADSNNMHRVVQTVDATSGTVAPVMTDALGSSAESYTVCASNSAGTSVCVPVPITSVTACPPTPSSITNGAMLWTGTTTNGTVTLNAVAPQGGTMVTLSTYDVYTPSTPAAATVPATVFVPAGSTSATFPITVPSSFVGEMTVGILATANGTQIMSGTTVVSGNIYVTVDLEGYGLLPEGVPGSLVVFVRNAAPAGGGVVTFAQTLPAVANVPGSLTIPAGQNVVSMVLDSKGRGNDVATATYEGSSYQVTLPMTTTLAPPTGGNCRATNCD